MSLDKRNEDDKEDTSNISWATIGLIFLMVFVSMPISAMVIGAACERIWNWLLVGPYGEGPTIAQWFGIASIYSIITSLKSTGMTDKKFETQLKKHPVRTVIEKTVSHVFTTFMTLLAIAFTIRIMGWN